MMFRLESGDSEFAKWIDFFTPLQHISTTLQDVNLANFSHDYFRSLIRREGICMTLEGWSVYETELEIKGKPKTSIVSS